MSRSVTSFGPKPQINTFTYTQGGSVFPSGETLLSGSVGWTTPDLSFPGSMITLYPSTGSGNAQQSVQFVTTSDTVVVNGGSNSSSVVQNAMITWSTNVDAAIPPSSANTGGTLSYAAVNHTLAQLQKVDVENEDWRVETPVCNASIGVAALLMENGVPEPVILTHGPKSVVFNWCIDEKNLYLTITKSKLYVLASSPDGIQVRCELTNALQGNTSRFFSALGNARLFAPPEPSAGADTTFLIDAA